MLKTIHTRIRSTIFVSCVALASTLSACSIVGVDEQTIVENKARADFVNTYWKLTSLNGEAVVMKEAQTREQHVIFRSKENSFNGFAGCNRFFGQYELAKEVSSSNDIASFGAIQLGGVGATRMACIDMGATEQVFLSALSKVASYKVVGEVLIFSDKNNREIAQFKAIYLK
jgi:heat shock protein HslJ